MAEFASLLFYLVIFSLSTLLFSLHKRSAPELRRITLTLSMLIPSIVAGARYQVGTDWENYNFSINVIRNTPLSNLFQNPDLKRMEYGCRILMKFLAYFLNNRFIFGVFAFLTLFFVVKSLTNDYADYSTSVAYFVFLLIYFSSSFNIMRQCLAVSIVFWAMRYVYSGRFWRYEFWVLVAVSVHLTAVFALPIYFLWDAKKKCPLSFTSFAPFFFAGVAAVIFWRRALAFLMALRLPFLAKYAMYLRDNDARNRDFFVKMAIFLFILMLYLISKKRTRKQKLFLEMGIINLLIASTGFYITFFKRAGLYYEIPIILLSGSITKYFSKDSRLFVAAIIGAVAVAYFTLVYYILGDAEIIPYRIM